MASMSHKVTEKEQTLAFCIHTDSFKALAKSNFKAFWGSGRVIFRTLKEVKGVKKKSEVEGTAGESSSQ
jgi:hypothetical protein